MRFVQDVRLAVRRMRRNPTFAASVAGTLALGVAAATSIYTVVDGVLLKPLPFPDPDALVRVTSDYVALNQKDTGMSQPELQDYRARSGAFEELAGVWPITANLTGSDRPERVEVLLTSANYFALLRARPLLGRVYEQRDEIPGIATLAVISEALWRRGFGSDPNILGRTLRIDEDVYEIIGVMPSSFRHPSVTLETDVEVWAPTGWSEAPFPRPGYGARFMPSAIARLRAGVSIDAARARVEALGADIAREHPDDYPARLGWTPRVYPLAGDLVAGIRPVLLMLMGGIVFVLLIAVSNISNLLLVRSVEREREIAIQRALGATRRRVVVALLVEGLVLALVGGAAGFLGSLWGVDLLLRLVPERLPRVSDIAVDRRVFLFAVAISVAAGLLVSLGPALQSAQAGLIERLKSAGRGLHGGTPARVRSALVIAQVAIAVVLLAGAALLVRSLWNLQAVDTGMAIDRLTTARVWLPQPNNPEAGPFFTHQQRVAVIRRIVERLQGSAGVQHAAMATALPAVPDTGIASFAAEGWPAERTDSASATGVTVTPAYFDALGIRLLAGRLLTDADDERAPRAVVVNERFATTYFPGEEPVGRRFRFVGRRGQIPADAPWITVVGVVSDVREDGIDRAVRPQYYQSLWQVSNLNLAIVAQGQSRPPAASTIQHAVAAADGNLPVYSVRTGEGLVAAQLASRRFATTLINAFAISALLLAALGLHGVVSYGVRQRTHEFGVRVALGATTARIMALVLGQAARLTAFGVAIGLAGTLVVSRLIATMLFDVQPGDPVTLAGVVILLAAVVLLATLGAARRAARIEAAVALRSE
jgi:putative ABC transport system permease protein